jgi:hypothetical protein
MADADIDTTKQLDLQELVFYLAPGPPLHGIHLLHDSLKILYHYWWQYEGYTGWKCKTKNQSKKLQCFTETIFNFVLALPQPHTTQKCEHFA